MSWLHPSATIRELLDDLTGHPVDARFCLATDRHSVVTLKHEIQVLRVEGGGEAPL